MKKINVAELLKDCPSGMELDCTMIDNVVFEKLDFISSHHPIIIRRRDSNKTIHLTKYGQYSDEGDYKCVIFPKGKTTWDGFVPPCKFKDGDVLYCDANADGDDDDCYKYVFILKEINGTRVIAHCFINVDRFIPTETYLADNIYPIRLATKEEKEKLFQAIKDNGYKWNEETKTLEKLIEPKFKVGDKIKYKNGINKDGVKEGIILSITDDTYDVAVTNDMGIFIPIADQDNWELVPNKFDISTLVPFESKVLVRAVDNQFWRPAIWGVKHWDWDYCCVLGGDMWEQCIPYEGNEHLLGTNNDCDEFYKNW